jgi:hypothetical protein
MRFLGSKFLVAFQTLRAGDAPRQRAVREAVRQEAPEDDGPGLRQPKLPHKAPAKGEWHKFAETLG